MPYRSEAELAFRKELLRFISKSNLTYCEVMSALKYLIYVLQEKGENLLDGANIQEVAKRMGKHKHTVDED